MFCPRLVLKHGHCEKEQNTANAYLFILVGSDSNELSLFEGNIRNQAMTRADTHDMELRFIFVKGVQHDLKKQTKTYKPLYLHQFTSLLYRLCMYYTKYHTLVAACIHLQAGDEVKILYLSVLVSVTTQFYGIVPMVTMYLPYVCSAPFSPVYICKDSHSQKLC